MWLLGEGILFASEENVAIRHSLVGNVMDCSVITDRFRPGLETMRSVVYPAMLCKVSTTLVFQDIYSHLFRVVDHPT